MHQKVHLGELAPIDGIGSKSINCIFCFLKNMGMSLNDSSARSLVSVVQFIDLSLTVDVSVVIIWGQAQSFNFFVASASNVYITDILSLLKIVRRVLLVA